MAAILILIATIILECLIFLHIVRLPFIQITFMGLTHSPTHWVGWIGTIYIAITAPILPLVIKKAPKLTGKVLNMHILGNVIAILFISVHFAHQVTRSLSRYPDLPRPWNRNSAICFNDFTSCNWIDAVFWKGLP